MPEPRLDGGGTDSVPVTKKPPTFSDPATRPRRGTAPDRIEYARLELKLPVRLKDGGDCNELVIYRPNAGIMSNVLEGFPKFGLQVERFANACCSGLAGSGEPRAFEVKELSLPDSTEIMNIINTLVEEAEAITLPETGDGISAPNVYTLQRPIKMSIAEDGETVLQFEFMARRLGEISDYLDVAGRGELAKEFLVFMRTFAKPIGVRIPIMHDALINSIDCLDYIVILRQIMGKWLTPAKRWKPTSTAVH